MPLAVDRESITAREHGADLCELEAGHHFKPKISAETKCFGSRLDEMQQQTESAAAPEIPVIDVGEFVAWDARRSATGEAATAGATAVTRAIDDACRNVGFMVLTNTGIEDSVMDNALEATKKLFASSEAEKLTASNVGDKNYRGYER